MYAAAYSLAERPRESLPQRLRRNLTIQDYILVAFHGYFFVRALLAPDSPAASQARLFWRWIFGAAVLGIVLARGELVRRGWLRALIYRASAFVPVPISYLGLQHLLPALQPRLLDAPLQRIDEAIFFGQTPARWLEPLVSAATVEWFGFFYWSYLPLLALHLIPMVLFGRGRAMRELLLGSMMVTAIGHTAYTLVPGAGPHAAMQFSKSLSCGGYFWKMALDLVADAGARYDIFPSLHTALPTFFTLVCVRNRRSFPLRYTWPITAVFTGNIIVATMLLRWHWGVDILAGLGLAALCLRLAIAISDREADRARHGRQPVWEPLFGSAG